MAAITDGPLTALALCWTVERKDGAGLSLTSHDSAQWLGDDRCEPKPGMIPAAVTSRLGLEPGGSEVAGALTSDGFAETDLVLGRWDGARVALHAVDWDVGGEPVLLLGGELGGIAMGDGGFTAELHGVAARLDEPVCPATSPECRAEFGGKECRVNLAGRSLRAAVLAAEANELTVDVAVDGRFLFGRLRYLSGPNCGAATVLLGMEGNVVRVRDLPRADVAAGTIVELREGCDKRFETCRTRFGNAANFRGEPHLPGNDLLTRYPGG